MAGLKQVEGAGNGNWVFSPDIQCFFFVTTCCLSSQCADDYGSVLSPKEAAFSTGTGQGPGTERARWLPEEMKIPNSLGR